MFYNHKRKLLNHSLCLCINFDTNNKRLHFLLRKRIRNMAFTKRANSLVDKLTKHLFSSSHTKSISKVKFSCNLLHLILGMTKKLFVCMIIAHKFYFRN